MGLIFMTIRPNSGAERNITQNNKPSNIVWGLKFKESFALQFLQKNDISGCAEAQFPLYRSSLLSFLK